MTSDRLIGIERLNSILRTVAASDLVTNGMGAISANLIAPSDGGKTSILLRALPPGARVLTDFTQASLMNVLDEKTPPRWIVVPDFNAVISHRPAVATLTLAFLLALLAEGVTEIPGVEGRAKLQMERLKDRGIRIALLTAMTPDMFYTRRGKWRSTGLLRRLVPIHYIYSAQTSAAIQSGIQAGSDTLAYPHEPVTRVRRREIAIPDSMGQEIRSLSELVTNQQLLWSRRDPEGHNRVTRAHDHPFSVHKMFRSYARAYALRHEREHVTPADLDGLIDFSRFVRYDRPEEI